MLLPRCLVCALVLSAPMAPAAPQVFRSGSQLRVELDTRAPRGWALQTASGQPCASGGDTALINIDKIASDEDLRLEINGGSSITIPAVNKISPLPQPAGEAVIYQLPVRTYFAKGQGKAQTGRLEYLTDEVLRGIKDMGVDYLWMTGLLEALSPDNSDVDVVKGDAGSYYAVTDNWDINSQVGTLDDFDRFVDRAHAAGLRVLLDLVVNHTARVHRSDVACKTNRDFGRDDDQGHFFARDNHYFYLVGSIFEPPPPGGRPGDGVFDADIFKNGIQVESPARVTGNNIASPQPRTSDWFETVKLNYGYDFTNGHTTYSPRPRTWDQMLDIARYWLKKGADGFRIDMAHAVPIEFYRYLTEALHDVNPNVFFVAEAYESDVMRAPGFSYDNLFAAGIDTVFNKDFYDRLREQGTNPGRFYEARFDSSPAMRPSLLSAGRSFTNFLENHDELRVASRYFATWVGSREQRGSMGYALSSFAALMPAHFLLHGGQEFGEDATVVGSYGDNTAGHTSIFDFVYQSETLSWLSGNHSGFDNSLRERYRTMLQLKKQPPFNLAHTAAAPSFADLHAANWTNPQSLWIGSYLRWGRGQAYLVVTNSDPVNSHEATIHFTDTKDSDPFGVLKTLGIDDNSDRWYFTEVLEQPGWQPQDPNIGGDGLPAWVLYQAAGVPSGLYLGQIPPASTLVFRIDRHKK